MAEITQPIINEEEAEATEPITPIAPGATAETPAAPMGMNEEVPPVPTGAGMSAPAGMSEEEMKADISNTLADLKTKRGAINAQHYISKNKLEAAKAKMIQSIFEILKNVGVDPTDLSSIQEFIQQLEEQDPDLLQLFNVAFDALSASPELGPDLGAMKSPMPEGPLEKSGLPIGAGTVGVDMPLPPSPSGPMQSEEAGPEAGGKFGNILGAMKQ